MLWQVLIVDIDLGLGIGAYEVVSQGQQVLPIFIDVVRLVEKDECFGSHSEQFNNYQPNLSYNTKIGRWAASRIEPESTRKTQKVLRTRSETLLLPVV